MKLKYKFSTIDMGDEIICVPVGEIGNKMQGILRVNSEGEEIINLLQNDTSEQKMVDELSQKYENDRSELVVFVQETLEKLRGLCMIED